MLTRPVEYKWKSIREKYTYRVTIHTLVAEYLYITLQTGTYVSNYADVDTQARTSDL